MKSKHFSLHTIAERFTSLRSRTLENPSPPLELWGGVECTYNRVGDRYFNQLEWNGHLQRTSDLDLFADLGIRAIRYPVVWEALAPNQGQEIDWSWPDERLNRLRELDIAPIADLVHHGSGPRYAEITSPAFAPGLARFARQVAERYPWIDAYTPVNEPLTTARFCGLYGHWYPHGTSNDCFVRVLLNECHAIALSMFAVREINPTARLVQTDDLGRIYSTPHMAYQAHFENLRRWLSFDLLCGRIDPAHDMWDYLVESGATLRELEWFCANPCPPDIMGINHYPTSDRYLDENLARYPEQTHGGNGRERYADVEAVRVLTQPLGGFKERLLEAWERYHIPLAITEAHLGCTREEQVRWTDGAWRAAQAVREAGADVRAVTAWSLLGAYNWNSLVTRDEGYYEPGVFDVRGEAPRPTAIAALLRDLGAQGEGAHPVLHQPGWWQRPERILYPGGEATGSTNPLFHWLSAAPQMSVSPSRDKPMRPLLIVGASGTIGQAFARACEQRGLPYYGLTREDIDILDPLSIETALEEANPWAVVNATGYTDVDAAQADPQSCFAVNTEAATHLANACARSGIPLICFSSDQVFDGCNQRPYRETDAPAPLSVYGRSKAEMEKRVLAAHPGALVTRSGACFGPHDSSNFVTQALRALSRGEEFAAASDVSISPTYAPDLAGAALDLLIDGASGIWHLSNGVSTSWAELARSAATRYGLDTSKIRDVPLQELPLRAPRPRFSALESRNGQLLPDLESALARYKWDVRL